MCRINRWTKNSAEPIENCYYAFLTFPDYDDLEFSEEVMKPERFIQALDHAAYNPDTVRVSKWYQKTTLKGDASHFSSFSRTSDT